MTMEMENIWRSHSISIEEMGISREFVVHLLRIQHLVLVEELEGGQKMRIFLLQTRRHLSQIRRRRLQDCGVGMGRQNRGEERTGMRRRRRNVMRSCRRQS